MSPRLPASPDLRFDTGRVALDLVATVGARLSDRPVERLTDPRRLDQWLAGVGLLGPESSVSDPSWLDAFVGLREVIHRLVHARIDAIAPASADLHALNALAGRAGPRRVLHVAPPVSDDQSLRATWTSSPARPLLLTEALAQVAGDAVDLLVNVEPSSLHECAGDTCDLVFVDVSRGQRRRWCSAGACGNRARVAVHRQRRSSDGTSNAVAGSA